mmetsp:Transcript_47852/g.103681  ORF Transcript_47852/g.103681 Transcript_47852/m.103681 type:complete len:254 (-) Transcript_47852:504-1265(-)
MSSTSPDARPPATRGGGGGGGGLPAMAPPPLCAEWSAAALASLFVAPPAVACALLCLAAAAAALSCLSLSGRITSRDADKASFFALRARSAPRRFRYAIAFVSRFMMGACSAASTRLPRGRTMLRSSSARTRLIGLSVFGSLLTSKMKSSRPEVSARLGRMGAAATVRSTPLAMSLCAALSSDLSGITGCIWLATLPLPSTGGAPDGRPRITTAPLAVRASVRAARCASRSRRFSSSAFCVAVSSARRFWSNA